MEYSDEVLEETPERVVKFLSGLGAVATVRTLLSEAGMKDDDIIEGRNLLLQCLAAPRAPGAAQDTDDARAQRAAQAELDEWDEPNFARYKAALRRHFREAGDYVFHDLSAASGPAAVAGVATFLSRIDALETGSDPERKGSKTDDKKAVQFLATRGLKKAERDRLKKLVDVALGPTSPLPAAPDGATDARKKALSELRSWYEEWSSTARVVVKKRGYLIRLGLAARKLRKKSEK